MIERDELLAASTPHDLFGDAVGDRRGLKRAYARLAKQYRPDDDPEAFQHLRALYERALAGEQAREAPQTPPEPAPPRDLLHASREAMAEPDFLARAAREIPHPPWRLDAERLQGLLDLLDQVPPDIPLDPDRLSRLEDRLLDGLAGHAALADPAVPDALVAVAGHAGDRRALLEAFRALGQATTYDELAAAVGHLELHHPPLWALYHLAHRRLVDDGDVREGWMEGTLLEGNTAPSFPFDVPMAHAGAWAPQIFGLGVAAVAMTQEGVRWRWSLWFVLGVMAWHAGILIHRTIRGTYQDWTPGARAEAVRRLAAGHWPHELLDRALAESDIAPDQRVFAKGRTALALDTDLALLPHALTDAHAARVEAECTR